MVERSNLVVTLQVFFVAANLPSSDLVSDNCELDTPIFSSSIATIRCADAAGFQSLLWQMFTYNNDYYTYLPCMMSVKLLLSLNRYIFRSGDFNEIGGNGTKPTSSFISVSEMSTNPEFALSSPNVSSPKEPMATESHRL